MSLPAPDLAGRDNGTSDDGSHVHHAPFDGIGTQLFPGGLATTTPQHFVVASGPTNPRPDRSHGNGIVKDTAAAVCTADRPRSVRFEPTFHLRGFHHWFLHSCTSPSH